MDVPSSPFDPTRFLILAQQFVVSDGSVNTVPMVYQSGKLVLNIADIGTVNAGIITSTSGKTVFDVANGTLEFYD